MNSRITDVLRRYLIALVWVYFTLLALWALAYYLTGDRYPILALLNVIAPYLFIPLVGVLPMAFVTRRPDLWIGLGAAAGVFGLLWGGLFLPRSPSRPVDQPTLTVMSYNVYDTNHQPAETAQLIRNQNADVVLLQELTPELGRILEEDLSDLYPYQLLVARGGPEGMGTLSKTPIHPRNETLPLKWVGDPQILLLKWNGQEITLINFHMWPITGGSSKFLALNFRAREAQALHLAELIRALSEETPLIAAGDANATDLSDTYRFLSDVLVDSWREAGVGFGNTYPSSNGRPIPGSDWHPPQWLARIDYVFHSGDWLAVEAEVVDSSAGSDHRPVVVELVLNAPAGGSSLAQEPGS